MTSPEPEALLEHAAFLRRLTRSLVGDPQAAEDLTEEERRPLEVIVPLR